jgi:ABC-type Mn2+/Zn2+ transport system ATPase subunit
MTDQIRTIPYTDIPHQPDAPALEARNVSVSYPIIGDSVTRSDAKQYALKDLSFQINSGEQIAVVGPNGAGKSTLFKLIAGTLKPDEGTILMYGHTPDRHICIAYVPQRTQIDQSFPATVEDVVMMGRIGRIGLFRRPRQPDWDHVKASLAQVNVTHLTRKQIGELSGGQQQRVFIARALAQEAEIILLDEPLAGLDVPSQTAIFEILESLRPTNATVLVAIHDLSIATERFDRVMLLNKRLVAFDRGPQVLTAENLVATYGSPMHQSDPNDGLAS